MSMETVRGMMGGPNGPGPEEPIGIESFSESKYSILVSFMSRDI